MHRHLAALLEDGRKTHQFRWVIPLDFYLVVKSVLLIRLVFPNDTLLTGKPSSAQVAEVKALACQLPAEFSAPLSRWTCPELAYEAALRGIVESVSGSTVRRWLADDALKPWQYRSWISIRDPDFRAKATRVLDLYQRVWNGQPLGPDEYVISSDEKPSIQARCRCHPTLAPGKGRAMRVEHEYDPFGEEAFL